MWQTSVATHCLKFWRGSRAVLGHQYRGSTRDWDGEKNRHLAKHVMDAAFGSFDANWNKTARGAQGLRVGAGIPAARCAHAAGG